MKLETLSDLDREGLIELVARLGQPKFRARQLQEWLWSNLATTYDEMSNLPKDLRARLAEELPLGRLEVADDLRSEDGTVKWAFQDAQRRKFESVLIPDLERRTACISSQVGCAMGCAFCRTATMGFIRNLSSGEVLQQVAHVSRFLRATGQPPLSNIVFMGMGEPLNNLPNVLAACATLSSPDGFGMAARRITISTSGLVNKIHELAESAPQYHLAISLNSSNDETRNEVMPVNRRFDIAELMAAGDEWSRAAEWPVTYEYVLIGDVTCTPESARELKRLVRGRYCKINLIPLNPADDIALRAPTDREIEAFEAVIHTADVPVFRRKPKGRDILAACGQLARKSE